MVTITHCVPSEKEGAGKTHIYWPSALPILKIPCSGQRDRREDHWSPFLWQQQNASRIEGRKGRLLAFAGGKRIGSSKCRCLPWVGKEGSQSTSHLLEKKIHGCLTHRFLPLQIVYHSQPANKYPVLCNIGEHVISYQCTVLQHCHMMEGEKLPLPFRH